MADLMCPYVHCLAVDSSSAQQLVSTCLSCLEFVIAAHLLTAYCLTANHTYLHAIFGHTVWVYAILGREVY